VTRYSFERTSTKKAKGNRSRECTFIAMSGQRTARPVAENMTMARRAPRLRSMRGPNKGETMANGAKVKSR
jgi:hypothetical protein